MESYEKNTSRKHKTCRSIDEIRHATHTWGDVMKEVEAARDGREEKHKLMRKLANNADDFEMWLHLLPNSMYTSIVCGAFKIGLMVSKSLKVPRVSSE